MALAHPPPLAGAGKRFPLLAQAILAGASAQIRNMATVGGNLDAAHPLHLFL